MAHSPVFGYFTTIEQLLVARHTNNESAESSARDRLLDADPSVLNEALVRYGSAAFRMIAGLLKAPLDINTPLLDVVLNPFTSEVVIPPAAAYPVEGAKAMLYESVQPRAVGDVFMMITALDFQPALKTGVLINSAVPIADKFLQVLTVAAKSSYDEQAASVAGHAGWLAHNYPATS